MTELDAVDVADTLDARLRSLDGPSVEAARKARREVSTAIREWPGADVLTTAHLLLDRHRWVAYELVYHHPGASAMLDEPEVRRLGAGLDSWAAVDSFCRYISGPAWQRRQLPDAVVAAWASSPDRWWRRAALVSTVPLNLRAAGGTGDRDRTLAICRLLVDDRDDMVVKALSWALRELTVWDPAAVQAFLDQHGDRLAPRVRREVANKLATGLKNPRR